jgi:hypothetical protein
MVVENSKKIDNITSQIINRNQKRNLVETD